MAISRGNSLLMKKQWAEDGSTVIPNPPVAGTTYRDESVDEANIAEGQKYDGVADSARWNQLLYIMTGILKDTLAHGVLPWINTQDYAEGAVVIGSNGTLYIAKIANGPTTTNVKDPTTDATADTWKTVLAISSVGEGLHVESNKLKLLPYKGATASEAGELGGVPPAAKEDKDKFLKGDGTWAVTAGLPLTGGTLTGELKFNLPGTEDHVGNIVALNDQYGKRLIVDTYEEGDSGAFLNLFKGSSEKNPGGFELCVRNAEGAVFKGLEARTDGNLRWDNKQIVRSVNGVTADSNGDVRTTDDMWVGEKSGGFTMPWDGLVIGRFAGDNSQEFHIYRNGNDVFYARNADQGYGTLNMPFCIAAYAGERVSAANNAWYGVRAVRK